MQRCAARSPARSRDRIRSPRRARRTRAGRPRSQPEAHTRRAGRVRGRCSSRQSSARRSQASAPPPEAHTSPYAGKLIPAVPRTLTSRPKPTMPTTNGRVNAGEPPVERVESPHWTSEAMAEVAGLLITREAQIPPSGRGAPGEVGCLDGSKASLCLRNVLARAPGADTADALLVVAVCARAPSGWGAPGALGCFDGSNASPRLRSVRSTDAHDGGWSETGVAADSAAISFPMLSGRPLPVGTLSAVFGSDRSTLPEASAIPGLFSVLPASRAGPLLARPATASVLRVIGTLAASRRGSWAARSSAEFCVNRPVSAPGPLAC